MTPAEQLKIQSEIKQHIEFIQTEARLVSGVRELIGYVAFFDYNPKDFIENIEGRSFSKRAIQLDREKDKRIETAYKNLYDCFEKLGLKTEEQKLKTISKAFGKNYLKPLTKGEIKKLWADFAIDQFKIYLADKSPAQIQAMLDAYQAKAKDAQSALQPALIEFEKFLSEQHKIFLDKIKQQYGDTEDFGRFGKMQSEEAQFFMNKSPWDGELGLGIIKIVEKKAKASSSLSFSGGPNAEPSAQGDDDKDKTSNRGRYRRHRGRK